MPSWLICSLPTEQQLTCVIKFLYFKSLVIDNQVRFSYCNNIHILKQELNSAYLQ